jgi:hypothetical protein
VSNPLASAAIAILLAGAPAAAQVSPDPPRLQTQVEAYAQDAAEYARRHAVPLDEAFRRLRAQEESVAATDAIAQAYAARLAGIAIEHQPAYRIVVLLTGSEPVPDQAVQAGGITVPIVFRTGAAATRTELVAAITTHQPAIRAALIHPPGMGVDPRTGELVLMVKAADAEAEGVAALDARFEALTGVPVRIRIVDLAGADFGIEGGARVEGVDPANGRRYVCTTGFVVTDGARTGIATAAHCPDELTYRDPDGGEIPLDFVGQWGWRYQDVQINVSPRAQRPLFHADTAARGARTLTSWRNRHSTRAGDAVCHRGERTGYSCAEVELIDYAPPGDLCGGPCEPSWVTVTGPNCRNGDSGGPVFSGTIAFGIAKGGSYGAGGACNFYYYMSTDYLPPGWRLLTAGAR